MSHFGMHEVEAIAKADDTPWEFMAINRSNGGKAVYIVPKNIPLNKSASSRLSPAFKRRMLSAAVLMMVLIPLFLFGAINLTVMFLLFVALGASSFISGSINIPYISEFFHGSDKDAKNKIRTIDYPLVKFNLTKFGEDKFISTNHSFYTYGKGLAGAVNNMAHDYKMYKSLFQRDYEALQNGSEIIVDKDAFKKYKDAIEVANNEIANATKEKNTLKFSLKGKGNKQIEAPKENTKNPLLDVYPKPVEEIQYLMDNNTHTFTSSNFSKILKIANHYEELNQKQMSDYCVCVRELVSAYKFNEIRLDTADTAMKHELYMKIYNKIDVIMSGILGDLSQGNIDNLTLIDGFLNNKYNYVTLNK